MIDPSHLNLRAERYATTQGLQLKHQLGFGKDGSVFSTSSGTAIKIFIQDIPYQRELACYQRLTEIFTRSILGHAVPQLRKWSDELLIIEMTIVEPPFVLDFASAYLDECSEFPAEVLEQWEHDKQEEFGLHWPKVKSILFTLEHHLGIYLLDVHPGNIAFPTDKP